MASSRERRSKLSADLHPGLGEQAFLAVSLLFFSGAQLVHSQDSVNDPTKSDPTAFLIQAFVYVVLAGFLYQHRAVAGRAAKHLYSVWMLVALAFCSAVWAQDHTTTVKRSIILLATTVFGIYFGTRLTIRSQVRILAATLGFAAASSFVAGLLFPGYGVMAWEPVGAWSGIYGHRNPLAKMMVLAILAFVFRKRFGGSRFLSYAGIALSLVLIVLSRSATAIVVLACMICVLRTGKVLRWERKKKIWAIITVSGVFVGVAAWIITNLSTVFAFLGRDMTLTGRVPLWIICAFLGSRKPWLGYGFNGFWRGFDGPSAIVWKITTWAPPNAHDGFLDMWLSLGLVGLAMFFAFLVPLLWRAVRAIHANAPPEALWPFCCTVFIALYNLDESDLFNQNSIMWMLLVAAAVAVSRQHWMERPSTKVSPSMDAA
jgi:O-antigen ligase